MTTQHDSVRLACFTYLRNAALAGSARFQKKAADEPRDLLRATRFFAAPRMV
jgi:hypothetical protein